MNSTQMPVIQIKARNSDCFLETTDHDGNSDETHQSISRVHQGTDENHIAKMAMYINENSEGKFSFHTRKNDELQEVMQITPDGISLLHSTLGKTGGISPTENGLCFYRGSDAPSPLSVADILINKDSDGQNVVKIGQNQNSRFEVKSTAVFHSSLIVKNENQEKLFECTPNGKVTIPKGELKIGNNFITDGTYGLKIPGKIGIGTDPSKYDFDSPDDPTITDENCYLKAKTGIIDQWLEIRGQINLGMFYGANNTQNPHDIGYGTRLYFNGKAYNTDPIWMARYNIDDDVTALRINVGDNGNEEDFDKADFYEIGCWDRLKDGWKTFYQVCTDGSARWYDVYEKQQMEIKNGDLFLNGNLILEGDIETRGHIIEIKQQFPSKSFNNPISIDSISENYATLYEDLMKNDNLKHLETIEGMEIETTINSEGYYFILFKMGGVQVRGKNVDLIEETTIERLEHTRAEKKTLGEIRSKISGSHAVFKLIVNGKVESTCWHEFTNSEGWSLRDVVLTCYKKIDGNTDNIKINVKWCVFFHNETVINKISEKHILDSAAIAGVYKNITVTEIHNPIAELVGCCKNDRRELIIIKT